MPFRRSFFIAVLVLGWLSDPMAGAKAGEIAPIKNDLRDPTFLRFGFPDTLRTVGHGFYIAAMGGIVYLVNFDKNEITHSDIYANNMFDLHAFDRGVEQPIDETRYVKTIDRNKGVVTVSRGVPLLPEDRYKLVRLVNFLWETTERFQSLGTDAGSDLYLKDGDDIKVFLTGGPLIGKPAELQAAAQEIFQRRSQ
jgi:hypothetical protein